MKLKTEDTSRNQDLVNSLRNQEQKESEMKRMQVQKEHDLINLTLQNLSLKRDLASRNQLIENKEHQLREAYQQHRHLMKVQEDTERKKTFKKCQNSNFKQIGQIRDENKLVDTLPQLTQDQKKMRK